MFKSLYKETEGFRLVSILTPLCMIGEVVMEMIIPKLMSSIIMMALPLEIFPTFTALAAG